MVKVSIPIAKWARDQTVSSQLGGATGTGPGIGTPGWGSLSTGLPAGRVAEGSKSRGYLAAALDSMYSQATVSCQCKLKPNTLLREQCSL